MNRQADRFRHILPRLPLLQARIDGLLHHVQGTTNLTDRTRDPTRATDSGEFPVIRSGLPDPPAGWSYYTFRSPGSVGTVSKDFLRARAVPAP